MLCRCVLCVCFVCVWPVIAVGISRDRKQVSVNGPQPQKCRNEIVPNEFLHGISGNFRICVCVRVCECRSSKQRTSATRTDGRARYGIRVKFSLSKQLHLCVLIVKIPIALFFHPANKHRCARARPCNYRKAI